MSRTFVAAIRFLLPGEGGRSTPPAVGVRPQLRIGDTFTSCHVVSDEGIETFTLGQKYRVALQLPFWAQYSHLAQQGMKVELFEGSHLVATGEFLEPISPPDYG